MVDRQKLESILGRRFPDATRHQIAAAANAIMGLEDDWEEVGREEDFAFSVSAQCGEACEIAREVDAGTEFRLLRRRMAE
jgi:hypothetical protein